MLDRTEVGMRVAYEDMANPRREGTVVATVELGGTTPSGHPLPSGREYVVSFDDGGETTSDLRQHGWTELDRERVYGLNGYVSFSLPCWTRERCGVRKNARVRKCYEHTPVARKCPDCGTRYELVVTEVVRQDTAPEQNAYPQQRHFVFVSKQPSPQFTGGTMYVAEAPLVSRHARQSLHLSADGMHVGVAGQPSCPAATDRVLDRELVRYLWRHAPEVLRNVRAGR